jgi:hypothetical protein
MSVGGKKCSFLFHHRERFRFHKRAVLDRIDARFNGLTRNLVAMIFAQP